MWKWASTLTFSDGDGGPSKPPYTRIKERWIVCINNRINLYKICILNFLRIFYKWNKNILETLICHTSNNF